MMKKVIITAWVVAVALVGLTAVTEAVQPLSKPYVHVSTSPKVLDLGTSSMPGVYDVPKALTVEVESNCLHGPIVISVTRLRHYYYGGFIKPEHILVRTSATHGFVAMDKPVVISRTTSGPHKIVLDLQVRTGFQNLAGKYKGTFTITVMPPV